ncbi:MAG: flagellar hook-associated protein FlgK [Hyphomonadaceae bacterium JAD_PAG50586_4]|nr:MAG: flagellar hook-associated protein FlgK [Hyphomonadaceae bacterium JAD_PAG50586_4]
MSISTVMLSGLSGLRASQTALGVVSQNIANANTPGYVRAELKLSPLVLPGHSGGVRVESVTRAADKFLSTASYIASASQASAAARADLLTRAQEAWGDPNGDSSMFAQLDNFWAALEDLGLDSSSALRRGDAVSSLQAMYSEVSRIGETIQSLIVESDQRIADGVDEAQDLMDRISDLNVEISLTKNTGADATAAENVQAALVDRLSQLMDVRVSEQAAGGVHIRTSGGALLVGADAAQLSYAPNDSNFATHGVIIINPQLGANTNLEPMLQGGEIRGLIQARDIDLPALAEALGGFAAELGDALNEAHNDSTASPAPSSLTGRQTGLLGTDSLGFTGNSIIGITDASGNLAQRLSIDFDTGTITGEDPVATYSFAGGSINDFVSALNSALGAATPPGSANFTGGVLSMNVVNGGIAIQQDATDPSDRAGRGFSHFFGMNDIVSRPTPMFFEHGVQGGDPHGFNAGGEITYQVRDSLGRIVGSRTIAIAGGLAAPGASWNDLVSELNAAGAAGLGDYGTFSQDPNTSQVTFASGAGYTVELLKDSTQRGGTGISFTALNGLSGASTMARGIDLQVSQRVANTPLLLAVGKPDMSIDIGDRLIEGSDNRGASALLAMRDTQRSFAANGALTAQTTTLAKYAARLGGEAGRVSSDADRAYVAATAVYNAAADRRASVESVNMDDELMKMTVYQNSYAASARVIQAATEMMDVLLSLGIR